MSRVLIATLVGLVGFILYIAAAVTLADPVERLHWSVQALYFLAAGLLWTIPARWLMYWAARR
ncbi:MAG: DUF2842 domain-containing protein [Alphaproteobacteria bacterium]|nr:DUF2842 domain-containing protein [Alphaproteobacteria bacterium]